MQFIPIDVMNTEPAAGGMQIPEGWYIMQVSDATSVRPEQNGQYRRREYKCKVVMGPGQSQDMVGKPYTYRLREDTEWAGRHMALFAACMGSPEAVRSIAQQAGGQFAAEHLHDKYFIVQLVKNDRYLNVVQVLPYTQENWDANSKDVAPATPNQGILSAQPGAMTTPPPVAASTAQPVMAPPPAAAPTPTAPSAMPPVATAPAMPAGFPAAPPAPPAPPAAAPAAAPGIPTPPPPPGHPAVG